MRMTMLLGDEIRMIADPQKENRILIEPLLAYRCNGNLTRPENPELSETVGRPHRPVSGTGRSAMYGLGRLRQNPRETDRETWDSF